MRITQDFVLFKLPNQNEFNYWELESFEHSENQSYFIFHSFDNKTTRRLYKKEGMRLSYEDFEKVKIDLKLLRSPENQVDSHENYINKCKLFVDALKNKELEKVILSRRKRVDLPQNMTQHMLKLAEKYPTAMVYLANFDAQTWMGASPEKLVEIQAKELSTVALASTKSKIENRTWSEKEYKEHQIVVDYIADRLKDFPLKIEETKTIDLGELQHLKTEFSAHLNTAVSVEQISNLLHPTPAVCGIPKDKSHQFILKNEAYDRSFYTGYFGPISKEKAEVYVNLRCAQLFENSMILYVGGGLLSESIPQNEWEETELKSRALI